MGVEVIPGVVVGVNGLGVEDGLGTDVAVGFGGLVVGPIPPSRIILELDTK